MLGCDTVIEARIMSLQRSEDVFSISYKGSQFSQPALPTRENRIEAELVLDDSIEDYGSNIYDNFLYVSDGERIFARAWLKRYQVEYAEGVPYSRITATAEFTDITGSFNISKMKHIYLLGKDLEVKLEEV